MFRCNFYNFDYSVCFETFEEAFEHGKKSGFQFTIIKKDDGRIRQ